MTEHITPLRMMEHTRKRRHRDIITRTGQEVSQFMSEKSLPVEAQIRVVIVETSF
jgi:hypothetical protein